MVYTIVTTLLYSLNPIHMPTKYDKSIRKILQLSPYSYGISLPVDDLRDLGWKEKQKVTVTRQDNKLIIEDWEK